MKVEGGRGRGREDKKRRNYICHSSILTFLETSGRGHYGSLVTEPCNKCLSYWIAKIADDNG